MNGMDNKRPMSSPEPDENRLIAERRAKRQNLEAALAEKSDLVAKLDQQLDELKAKTHQRTTAIYS